MAREGGRERTERALGEEGTTDIHHKAGCSGADGRGSSGSECRKLPECTAATATATAAVASPPCALLPSSVGALRCSPPWHFLGNRRFPVRVIRPVIPDVPEVGVRAQSAYVFNPHVQIQFRRLS